MTTTQQRILEEGVPPTEPFPFPTADNHAERPAETVKPVTEEPTEDALDHGIEESFPSSDPVSVSVTRVIAKTDGS